MTSLSQSELKNYWKTTGIKSLSTEDELNAVCYVSLPANFNHFISQLHIRHWQKAVSYLKNTPENILDIGCGTGRWAKVMRQEFSHPFKYLGVDIDREKISFCQQQFQDPQFNFATTDLTNWDSTQKFDFVNSVTVIQHLPPDIQEKIIAQISSHLKLNGYALIMELIDTSDSANHVFPRSKSSWTKLFEENKLTAIYFRSTEHLPILRFGQLIMKKLLGTKEFQQQRHQKKIANQHNSLTDRIIQVTMPIHRFVEPIAATISPNSGRVGIFLLQKTR